VKSSTAPFSWNSLSLGCQNVKTMYGGSWEISINNLTQSYQLTQFQFPNCAGKSFIHDSDCKQSANSKTCCTLQSPYLPLHIHDKTYSNVMSWSVNGDLDQHNEIFSFYQPTKQINCSAEDAVIELLPDWCYNIHGSYGTLQFDSLRTSSYRTEIFLDKGCTTPADSTILQCIDSCCRIIDLILQYQNATINPTFWNKQIFHQRPLNPVYIALISVGCIIVLVPLIVEIILYVRKRKISYEQIN